MTPDKTDTAVVIFAKYPRPGKVKTRLSKGEIPGHRTLNLDECAALYTAFLRDYHHRFSQPDFADFQACFCLRPGPDFAKFAEEFGTPPLSLYEEPGYQGQAAQDIGQALGYTFRGLLAAGFAKVIILGSDLPHFPTRILRDAAALLDDAPLVLGDDGGGCYLMAASAPAPILETGQIPWSEGRDFAALCDAQRAAGRGLATLPQVLEDIDTPAALGKLARALAQGTLAPTRIPYTYELLDSWGLLTAEPRHA